MKKILACAIAVVTLSSGCNAMPLSRTVTNNNDVPVDLLFSYDGCNVYRFRDGNYHYYVHCRDGNTTAAISQESCGKSCVEDNYIPTTTSAR